MNEQTRTVTKSKLPHERGIYHYSLFLPLLVLLITLLVTYEAWKGAQQDADQALQSQFNFSVSDIVDDVEKRMKTYEQVMRGVDGLFAHASIVKRDEFRDYIARLQLKENYPGIQGMRFVLLVPPAQKDAHIAAVRKEGLPEYRIYPEGERDTYTPVVYIEPPDARNKTIFGYDMFSDLEKPPGGDTPGTRRTAMEQARDTGQATISGKVKLLFEGSKDIQAGFLMFLPVYRHDAPHGTVAERSANIIGWISSVFRVGDLMTGTLGGVNDKIDVDLYDGNVISDSTLMYESDFDNPKKSDLNARFHSSKLINIAGHNWTLLSSSRPSFEALLDKKKPKNVASVGLSASVLLTFIAWLLVYGRVRALQAAAVVQRESFKNETLLRTASDGIYVFDLDGNVVQVNDAFCRMLGYAREEILSLNVAQWNAQWTEDELKAKIAALGSSNPVFETRHRRRDGSIIDVEISASSVKIGGQHLVYNASRDITERKRAEKELLELNETLEERVNARTRELAHAKELAEAASRAKSAFLSNMSHEIRTPMNSVMGMAHLALRTNPTPKQRDYLEKIRHSGEHLLGIIDDILDFSKIEAGKLSMENVNFKLDDVMENLVNMVGLKATEKHLKFIVDVDPALSAPLRGDPLRLGQVLINLANNAVKFTEQGEISVRARTLKEGNIDVRVRFEVRDSGIGISTEDRLKLFQSFQQADTSTTRKYGGTGLGLAICKQLVEMMDGEIGVESELGHGSTFWFTVRLGKSSLSSVPAPQNPEIAVVAGQADVLAAIKGAYVLLVEDNPFNQQVATELLEGAGVIICVANNGEEALDLLQHEQFDCVLMDVQMPVMDGFEATQQIRLQPELADIRVIAMTANAESEDRARCLVAGMDDFLTKPILPDLLYATLAKWVAGRVCTLEQQRLRQRRTTADRRAADKAPVAAALNADPATATPQANGSAIIDLTVLAKMVGNDPAKIRKFALKFLTSAQEGLDEIQAALAHRDMAAVAALGHRIKSPAKTVGALGFAELCQKLEHCKSDEDAEQAQSILSQLRELLEQITAQIETSSAEQPG